MWFKFEIVVPQARNMRLDEFVANANAVPAECALGRFTVIVVNLARKTFRGGRSKA